MHEITKQVWAAGDYPTLSKSILPVSAKVVRVASVRPGECVLDVACGTGPVAITARRAGAEVDALDITPELLARAKDEAARADVHGIRWHEGDAEDLPFEDASFDVVLSTFGHIFAPHPDVMARQMLRVIKRGGRIVFAAWPPESAVGAIFRAGALHAPPPPGANPLDWGVPSIVAERFAGAGEVTFFRDAAYNNALSPAAFWDTMSEKFGPLVTTLRALNDAEKIAALRRDWVRAVEPWFEDNRVRLDYLVARVVTA